MRPIRLLGLIICCVLAASPAVALAEGQGILRGQVRNGSAGGGAMTGLEVVLRMLEGEQERAPLTTTTDAQGAFRFQGLEMGVGWQYMAQVTYRDVVYSSSPVAFAAGKPELTLELPVYETTSDDAKISVERAHFLLSLSGSQLSILEMHVFANAGDRTFIGKEQVQGRRATSRFLLPKGSHDVAFIDGALGARFLSIEGGFVDTEPLWPGRTSVEFRYLLDCQGGACNLVQEQTYRVSALNVLIAEAEGTVTGERLTLEGKIDAQGRPYLNYVVRDLAPGDRLALVVRPRSGGAAPASPSRLSLGNAGWIILAVVVVVVVLGYPFWQQKLRRAAPQKSK